MKTILYEFSGISFGYKQQQITISCKTPDKNKTTYIQNGPSKILSKILLNPYFSM